jgi:hypothetical protein
MMSSLSRRRLLAATVPGLLAGCLVESGESAEGEAATVGTYDTTVDARLVVENAGRFTYGTVELRVDAYATVPSSPERDPVGFAYVTERFPSDDRFDDGTRRFDVSISFRSRETSARPDPEWYEVDAAVRRAESV